MRTIKVKRVTKIGKRQCYDITFPKTETFMARSSGASWFVVHNSGGMRAMSKEVKVSSFDDIVNINAMYRPGPLRAGFSAKYAKRKADPESVEYIHDLVKEATEETFGLVLFQEQFMRVFVNLAGFPLAEVDGLRKLVAKSKGKEVLAVHKERFVAGVQKNGLSKKEASKLFNSLVNFGGYSFNKSHSVAYSMLSFKTAMLKLYHPHEFFTALLKRVKKEDKLKRVLTDMDKHGVKILPPDVNKSSSDFELEKRETNGDPVRSPVKFKSEFVPGVEKYNGVRCGMLKVKFVGEKACDVISSNAPYSSFEDFLLRVDRADKRMVENLIVCGFFDSLHPNRRALFDVFETIRSVKDWKKYLSDGITFLDNSKRNGRLIKKATDRKRDSEKASKQILEAMKQIKELFAGDDWSEDEKDEIASNVYPILLRKHPVEYYRADLEKLKFNRFVDFAALAKVKEDIGSIKVDEEKKKNKNGQWFFVERRACILAVAESVYKASWGEWLSEKPTEEQLKKGRFEGIDKYEWGSRWLKVIALDVKNRQLSCSIKPDVYNKHAVVLDKFDVGVPFVAFGRIMNCSDRFDVKRILPLPIMRDMLNEDAKPNKFCDRLVEGKLKVDITKSGKHVLHKEAKRLRKWLKK